MRHDPAVGKRYVPDWIPSPHPIVGLTVFKDRLFVATERGVYELIDGILKPVPFHLPEPPRSLEELNGPVDSVWVPL